MIICDNQHLCFLNSVGWRWHYIWERWSDHPLSLSSSVPQILPLLSGLFVFRISIFADLHLLRVGGWSWRSLFPDASEWNWNQHCWSISRFLFRSDVGNVVVMALGGTGSGKYFVVIGELAFGCRFKPAESDTVIKREWSGKLTFHFEGRDKSVIIVSFVRSRPESEKRPEDKDKGSMPTTILHDLRRLNVAITRAKHKVRSL